MFPRLFGIRWFESILNTRGVPRRCRPSRRNCALRRPELERLENRTVPSVAATPGANLTAFVGTTTGDVVLATLADSNLGNHTADLTAVVNWGDGTGDFSSASANPVVSVVYTGDVNGNATYAVQATHTFTAATSGGPANVVSVNANDVGGGAANAMLTAAVYDNSGGFTYAPATKTLTIAGSNFTYTQATRFAGGVASTTFTFVNDGKTERFLDSEVTHVAVTGNGAAGTAILSTDDTYQGPSGTAETVESVSLGALNDAGAGTILRADAHGVLQPFLTLENYLISYIYAGRADGSVLLFGTKGLPYNGFVTDGYYSYMAGPGVFHAGVYASSVYGYTAGQPTDFSYQYMTHYLPGGSYVASGVAYSYTSGQESVYVNSQFVTSAYFNVGVGFILNTAYAEDMTVAGRFYDGYAYLLDSPMNDTFSGGKVYSYMYATDANGNYTEFNTVFGLDPAMLGIPGALNGFRLVFAESFVGGTDTAYIYDAKNITSGFATTINLT